MLAHFIYYAYHYEFFPYTQIYFQYLIAQLRPSKSKSSMITLRLTVFAITQIAFNFVVLNFSY